ncbi:MAG: hypothetical protein MJA83_12480, partial [Gammaproteobacteria bacterium]|nr:hypothetical protein [Gammaproteobacteria bacterium]
GVLVQNHIDVDSARRWISNLKKEISKRFDAGLLFTTDKYENGVIALYNGKPAMNRMRTLARRRLAALPRKDTRRLRAQWRTLTIKR